VGAQPAQRLVDLPHDGLAAEALAAGARLHAAEDLGGEHDFVPGREFLDPLARQFLAGTGGVDVGGVVEADAGLPGEAAHRPGLFDAEQPGAFVRRLAEAHAAEADGRDFETRRPKANGVHGGCPPVATASAMWVGVFGTGDKPSPRATPASTIVR